MAICAMRLPRGVLCQQQVRIGQRSRIVRRPVGWKQLAGRRVGDLGKLVHLAGFPGGLSTAEAVTASPKMQSAQVEIEREIRLPSSLYAGPSLELDDPTPALSPMAMRNARTSVVYVASRTRGRAGAPRWPGR